MPNPQWPHPDDDWFIEFILSRYPDVVRQSPNEIPRMVQLLKKAYEERGAQSIRINDPEGNVYLFLIETDESNDFVVSLTQQRS